MGVRRPRFGAPLGMRAGDEPVAFGRCAASGITPELWSRYRVAGGHLDLTLPIFWFDWPFITEPKLCKRTHEGIFFFRFDCSFKGSAMHICPLFNYRSRPSASPRPRPADRLLEGKPPFLPRLTDQTGIWREAACARVGPGNVRPRGKKQATQPEAASGKLGSRPGPRCLGRGASPRRWDWTGSVPTSCPARAASFDTAVAPASLSAQMSCYTHRNNMACWPALHPRLRKCENAL